MQPEPRIRMPPTICSDQLRRIMRPGKAGRRNHGARADVSDADQMGRALSEIRQRFGRIHGVIHAAGIAGGGTIQLKTRAAVESEFSPKIKGTLMLEDLLKDEPLDFFALCSSHTLDHRWIRPGGLQRRQRLSGCLCTVPGCARRKRHLHRFDRLGSMAQRGNGGGRRDRAQKDRETRAARGNACASRPWRLSGGFCHPAPRRGSWFRLVISMPWSSRFRYPSP